MRETRAHNLLEFGERLNLALWETCHIYTTCQAYRAEADFQQTFPQFWLSLTINGGQST